MNISACCYLALGVGIFLSSTTAWAEKEREYLPAATLAEEIKTTQVNLVEGYAPKHPRLLYGAEDLPALKAKAQAHPALWKEVLASSKRLGDSAPDSEQVSVGAKYWRIEAVQSAALAYGVTGEKIHLDRATRWMLAHCKEPIWGTGYGSNHDLQASWYLYHISLAYDALYHDLSAADRKAIREGLASHAKAIFDSLNPARKDPFTYDQNHLYIPTVALTAAALALVDEVPEARDWLKRSYAIMQRCRYVLGHDGWYYEGPGYWSYALHWHVRYADLLGRATGEKMHDLPMLRENWRFPLLMTLPGAPGMFDVGDTHGWKDSQRGNFSPTNHALLWGLAGALKQGESQTAGDMLWAIRADCDYPAASFLWFDPSVAAVSQEKIKPYHHFADHGFVAWRSGWGPDDTAYLFRCGPSQGHAATAKIPLLKDWRMNSGHVHADIGGFWMYAKGTYLASDTGYTTEKWTKDQNTILIDGIGQAMDGTYHQERGYLYEKLNQARIDSLYLSDRYAFVSGEYGKVYPANKVGDVSLRRTVIMTKGWMVVVDDLRGEREHKLTWICHSDQEFKKEGEVIISRHAQAALAVLPVGKTALEDKMEATMVMAGTAPGVGKPQQRGYQISRTMLTGAKRARLVHVLVPLGKEDKAPIVKEEAQETGVALSLVWPNGKTERVRIDESWLSPSAVSKTSAEPVTISNK